VEPSWKKIEYKCPICGALLAVKLRDRKTEFADQVISVRECEHFIARKVQEGYNEDVDFYGSRIGLLPKKRILNFIFFRWPI